MAKTLDEVGVKRLIQEIKGANKNLNTPIPISTENTPESMAQNMQNIADYVEKAKAAGIANVNGMGVTCMMDDYYHYSGVGYLFLLGEKFIVQGVLIKDDLIENKCFALFDDGEYFERGLIVSGNERAEVSSDMLAKGARKPIILTPETTEVDEETYQKLLSDDVDVVFKMDNGNLCLLTSKYDSGSLYTLYFTCFLVEGETDSDVYLHGYEVTITKISPHTCSVSENLNTDFTSFLTQAGVVNQDVLYRVLKEIDLTGTDAERLAALKNFENIWKDLTGASDLRGARFVGYVDNTDNSGTCSVLFTFEYGSNVLYQGCVLESDTDKKIVKYTLNKNDGSLVLTPLFSHLEAITIYTDNTAEHMQANLDNIAAYEANLEALGVDTTKSPMIPFKIAGSENESGIIQKTAGNVYTGYYCYSDENRFLSVRIEDGNFLEELYPTNSDIVDVSNYEADNEFRAKSLEAITIKTSNSTTDKADNIAAINAYADNLKALGVDVTKGYMIPIKLDNGYHGFIMGADADGAHTGVIKRGIYNYGGGWIIIDTEGTYKYLECLTLGTYDNLTTTAKTIVPAINEVNALAKGVKAFGAIELKASDNAANKAAITAYLKILTDAGVSTTNGYAVPVRITGNSQEYHGMLNIGTGVLLSGVVADVNENHHYPFNVSTTDGVITFDESNYFLEKTSNEVTEMLDAIKYSYTSVPFTDTTLSNKAQLEVFLSKVPAATVLHCTYNEIWAGTLHKINGDWYGLLVKNTNSPADNINVKLSADGTIIKSNSAQ